MGGEAISASARTESLARWITFIHLPGVGLRRRQEILEQFGSIEAVFDASRGLLGKYLVDAPQAVRAIADGPDSAAVEATLAWLAEPGHHLLTLLDPDYPPLLRQIPDPPLALYVIGDRACLSLPQLAVVGSRNPTPGGRENARAFARSLAGAGLAITSGLALGIDGEAHRGALDAGGCTIAVTGTGLDRVYPAAHRDLAHDIAGRGALVSEFALGSPPKAEHFPVRNRIISGLSFGTLTVEAAERSGSLITARLAGEQGREVFAIPGSIHSPQARGCHRLIRQGAKLVETAQDILEELAALASFSAIAAAGAAASETPRPGPADIEAQKVLAAFGHDAADVDQLVMRSGLTADVVSSILLRLELAALVAPCGGGRYQPITRSQGPGE
ncbi:MAG: DNA-processing protein DprA [Pseudomonadota bacterium]